MPEPAPAISSRPLDRSLLDRLGTAVRRRLHVDSIHVADGRAGSVRIERVEVGTASIESVAIEEFATRLRCGSALLRNVRAILELHFEVRWSYDLKLLGSDQGTRTLGSNAKTIPLHDLRIPMLQDIAVEVPAVEVSDVAATVLPVAEIALAGARFEDVAVEGARLPSSGFRVAGLGFRSLEVERVAAADADSARVRIARFAPDQPLRLPDVQVESIQLPDIDIPDVSSPEPVSLMDIQTEPFEAPAFKIGDLFKVVFVARPVLHLQIGELVLSDLSASASIGAVQVNGVTTPVAVHGLELGGVTLNQISAGGISV